MQLSEILDDILFTEFENDENIVVKLVLIDEKFGFIKLDSEERPGPEQIDGYTVHIQRVNVDIFEEFRVDNVCKVENGDSRLKTSFMVEYILGIIVEKDENVAILLQLLPKLVDRVEIDLPIASC